jgi:hypothetical protein
LKPPRKQVGFYETKNEELSPTAELGESQRKLVSFKDMIENTDEKTNEHTHNKVSFVNEVAVCSDPNLIR